MNRRLNVLLVEDSVTDAELLLEELTRNGYQLSHQRVESAPELEAALARRAWDIVVADYTMPQFSGMDALKVVREKGRDLPFIVVSGSVGEDLAVDMMKAGADDYVMKNCLTRLIPAIERELKAVEIRRAKTEAESAMQHLAAIVESSEDAIYSESLGGVIISWNRAATQIFGYTAREIIGASNSTLLPQDRVYELQGLYERILNGAQIGNFETIRTHKDGHCFPVSLTISPIKDRDGRIRGAAIIARDITGRKKEEEDRLRLIDELTAALQQVQVLKGLLPICASCKKIRDDSGYWNRVETYFEEHTQVQFTHGICPDCMDRLYPEVQAKLKKKAEQSEP